MGESNHSLIHSCESIKHIRLTNGQLFTFFIQHSGWNLIGYSSNETNLSLADAKFTNASGSSYTWAQALANNKVQAYLSYYDSSSALASGRKYKYLATSDLGMDDSLLRANKGYWKIMSHP